MSQINLPFHTLQFYWNSPKWLGNRMLFLSGPRQVGKTTLVTSTLCPIKEAYFNWDVRKVRLAFQKDPDFFSNVDSSWICFDEIHKRPKWKDILKGIYDLHKNHYQFVVTGSARLDTFKKSGDSLVGRYFHTQLFPLNLPDFSKNDFALPENPLSLIRQAANLTDAKELDDLLSLGGFPEPFYSSSETFWKRWSSNHRELILREDLRDLSRISEVDKIENLMEMLHPSIGQLINYSHLARDLEASHVSIKRWLEMLARLELIFSVSPYSKNIRKAYKQEKKWYYVDWRAAEKNLFENYVASSLYRATSLYTDRFGDKITLHFIRTHNGTEIDFLICREQKPWLLIEAKEGNPEVSKAVHLFSAKLKVPCIIVTRKKNIFRSIKSREGQKIFCISWSKFGQLLP